MPQKSKLNLPPLNLFDATLGQRIARLRKERGFTQLELAEKIGIIRGLISDYERDRLRPHYEMIIRLAMALEVTADELLGLKSSSKNNAKPSLTILRRLKRIEKLPSGQKKTLLRTIDLFLKAANK
jgi:transcriptional regulator with XRE-family HTH domain